MEKVIIYGAGGIAPHILDMCLQKNMSILAFSDSDERIWGYKINDISIIPPDEIMHYDYDEIIIGSINHRREIVDYLLRILKIPPDTINDNFVKQIDEETLFDESSLLEKRIAWLHQYAELVKDNHVTGGCVAEVGVFRGEFAKEINTCFPTRTLYLFDTFVGPKNSEADMADFTKKTSFETTSVEIVRKALPYPEKAVFKVGYFPETTIGGEITDDFLFVNLDCNFYQPTFAGLEFFWPRMIFGGVVLVHDYFCRSLQVSEAIKHAVNDFCKKYHVYYIPIGDVMSVAFIKQ